jgi:RNA polymerase sigma-B factor
MIAGSKTKTSDCQSIENPHSVPVSSDGFKADVTIKAKHVAMQLRETSYLTSTLIKNYERLVHKQVHFLKVKTCEPYEDLYQVGCIGLLVALRKFDTTRQVSFTSFAVPYIRGHILHHLRDKSSMVRVPRKWHEIYSKLRKKQGDCAWDESLKVSPQELEEIKSACANRAVTKELCFEIPDSSQFVNVDEQLQQIQSNLLKIIEDVGSKVTTLLSEKEHQAINRYYLQRMSVVKAARASRLSSTEFKALISQALDKISTVATGF